MQEILEQIDREIEKMGPSLNTLKRRGFKIFKCELCGNLYPAKRPNPNGWCLFCLQGVKREAKGNGKGVKD